MVQPRFRLVVRYSPDWARAHELDAHDPEHFTRAWDWQAGSIARMIGLWNRTFGLSFYLVRQRLKEIAQKSLQPLRTEVESIAFEDYLAQPVGDDAYYLFIDDDDWYAPDLVLRLAEMCPASTDVLIWGSVRFRQGLEPRPLEPFCYTNNYAVLGRLAGVHDGDRLTFTRHDADVLSAAAAGGRYALVPGHLSVANKHPAAATMMKRVLAKEFSGDALRRSVEAFVVGAATVQTSDDLEWAVPLAKETVALFEEVLA